ncbi:MAG TPA: hypothetical protein VGM70_03410 [Pseudolysinimonas sp.]|jgi:hypothetical protein
MNRTPKWLIPVLAVIAALAVAAAAVLVGTHFASPDVQIGATKKATVPVIGPLDDPKDKKAKSEIIGKTTVTLPGTSQPVVPLGQQNLIDAVTHSADPHATIVHHGASGGGAAPAADPCSPGTGPVPPACPAGTRGRIRADLPTMWVNVLPFAPAHSATPEDPRCPAPSSTSGEVPIGVSAPAPAHYVIDYWPVGEPSNRSEASVDTDATDRAAYQMALNDPTVATTDLPVQHSCIVLHVDPTVSYSGQVVATDDNGRVSDPNPTTFDGDGGAVHPQLELSTIGDNLLVMSAVARDDQRVEFYLVPATSAGGGTCDSTGVPVPSPGPSATHPVVVLPASDVTTNHWPARFTKRYTQVTGLPFGQTVLACARWFTGTTFGSAFPWAPSSAPLYESRQMVSSPDKLVPTLTTTGFDGGIGESQLTVSTTSGVVCRGGTTTILRRSSRDIAPTPYNLCSATFDGAVRTDGSGRYWSDPIANDFLVSVDQSTIFGHYTNRDGIPAPLLPCTGSCTIPAPRNYRVSIDPSSNLRGWWDFQLVYTPTAGGSRLSTWSLGGVSSTVGAAPAPSGPTFDTSSTVGTTGLDLAGFTVSASVPVAITEPVDYAIRILPSETSGPLQCPPSPVPHAEGHLERSGTIVIPGLCLASTYHARVTLTDAGGHTMMWDSLGTDPSGLWPGATFSTPGLPSTLHWDLTATGPANGYVSDLEVQLQGLYRTVMVDSETDPVNGHCLSGGRLHVGGTIDGSQIGAISFVFVQYRIRSSVLGGAICTPAGAEPLMRTGSLHPVSLQEMVAATPAVTVTDPAGRYTITLSLVPTH